MSAKKVSIDIDPRIFQTSAPPQSPQTQKVQGAFVHTVFAPRSPSNLPSSLSAARAHANRKGAGVAGRKVQWEDHTHLSRRDTFTPGDTRSSASSSPQGEIIVAKEPLPLDIQERAKLRKEVHALKKHMGLESKSSTIEMGVETVQSMWEQPRRMAASLHRTAHKAYKEHRRRACTVAAVSIGFLWVVALTVAFVLWAPSTSPMMCYPRTFPRFEETSCFTTILPFPADPTRYTVRCGYVEVHEDQSNCQQKRAILLHVVVVRLRSLRAEDAQPPLAIYGTSMEAGAVNFSPELLRVAAERELVFVDTRGTSLSVPRAHCDAEMHESAWQIRTNSSASIEDHLDRARTCALRLIAEDIRPSAYDRVQASFDLWNVRLALRHPQWHVLSVGPLASETVALYHRFRDPASCLNVSYLSGSAPSQFYPLQATESLRQIATRLQSDASLEQAFDRLQTAPDNTTLSIHDSGLFRSTASPSLPTRIENVQLDGRLALMMLYNGMRRTGSSTDFSKRFSATVDLLANPATPLQQVFPLNSFELDLYHNSLAVDWPLFFSAICTKRQAVDVRQLLGSPAFEDEAIRWQQWVSSVCAVWPTSKVHGFENVDPGVQPIFARDGVFAKSRAVNGRLDPETPYRPHAALLSTTRQEASADSRDSVSMDWKWYKAALSTHLTPIQESAFGNGPQPHPNTLKAHERTHSYGLFDADLTWLQVARLHGALP